MVTHFWMCLMHVSIYQFYTELSKGVKIAAETITVKNKWMNASLHNLRDSLLPEKKTSILKAKSKKIKMLLYQNKVFVFQHKHIFFGTIRTGG